MGTRTSYTEGTFSWVDCATTDLSTAKKFYGEIMGWAFTDLPTPQGVYSKATFQGKDVAAIYECAPESKTPPHWMNYITVNDVAAMTKKATDNGATICMGPMDVMDAGKMSMIHDPTGATVALWQPVNHHGAGLVNDPGSFCWNELWTSDPAKAKTFYSDTLGWTYEVTTEPMTYNSIVNKGNQNGGIMNLADADLPEGTPSHWTTYFSVPNTDMTVEKAVGLGAKLTHGPMDIPEIGRFAILQDPLGAYFTIIQLITIDP